MNSSAPKHSCIENRAMQLLTLLPKFWGHPPTGSRGGVYLQVTRKLNSNCCGLRVLIGKLAYAVGVECQAHRVLKGTTPNPGDVKYQCPIKAQTTADPRLDHLTKGIYTLMEKSSLRRAIKNKINPLELTSMLSNTARVELIYQWIYKNRRNLICPSIKHCEHLTFVFCCCLRCCPIHQVMLRTLIKYYCYGYCYCNCYCYYYYYSHGLCFIF